MVLTHLVSLSRVVARRRARGKKESVYVKPPAQGVKGAPKSIAAAGPRGGGKVVVDMLPKAGADGDQGHSPHRDYGKGHKGFRGYCYFQYDADQDVYIGKGGKSGKRTD